MNTTYPKRPPHFDRQFMKVMIERSAGSSIRPDGFALLAVIVWQEDRVRYAGAVDFWSGQLSRHVRTGPSRPAAFPRQKAGWKVSHPFNDETITTIKVKKRFAWRAGVLACSRRMTVAEVMNALMDRLNQLNAEDAKKWLDEYARRKAVKS